MSKRNNTQPLHEKLNGSSSLILTAVALQDHWSRSLSLGTHFGPRNVRPGVAARAKQNHEVKSLIDTGRQREKKKFDKVGDKEKEDKEYVLDAKLPPLTLAQKFGLVYAPKPLLSEQEWENVKAKSNQRDDSKEPCVICKEDFGVQEQVILSCTHVFHRACLQALERFTGRKTCPMCRHQQYQTRVIQEGARVHKHKCATRIQSLWRGYVVRCWYKQLRETVPPKDPALRKKFYEEKLSTIVDRIVRSVDVNMAEFMREIDSNVQQSRAVFRQWDAVHNELSLEQWDAIQLKAVERGQTECPICLTELCMTDDVHCQDSDPKHSQTELCMTDDVHCQDSDPKHSQTELCMTDDVHCQDSDPKHSQTEKQPNIISCSVKSSNCKNSRKIYEKGKLATDYPIKFTLQTGKNLGHVRDKSNNPNEVNCSTPGPSNSDDAQGTKSVRSTVLLSCTHVFHTTCLNTLEEIAMQNMKNTCPVCRAYYQKKIIVF